MDQSLMWWLVWTGLALVLAELVFYYMFQRRLKPSKRLPPGPKPKPLIGNLGDMSALSHTTFAKFSSEYGPLIHVRIGSVPFIVANSSDLAKEILKTKDKTFANRPASTVSRELNYGLQNMGASPIGPRWRTIRKLFVRELLTPKRVCDFKDVRKDEATKLLSVLLNDARGGESVQIGVRMKDHLGNIVTSLTMNKRFFGPHADAAMDSPTFQRTTQGILDLLKVFVLGEFFPLFKYWDVQGLKKKLREAHSKLDKFLQAQIDDRRQKLAQDDLKENQAKSTFLDVLLSRSGENDEYPMTDTHFKGILQDSIFGGIDTTAGVVEWTLAELMKNPEKMRKAQEELDSVVGRERLVDEADINNLPYINAAINESLRLHPSIPLLVPHLSLEDAELGGFHIPANSPVYVNVWAISRDPQLWENPMEFSPERFLGSLVDSSGLFYQFLPFGSGRRRCPGRNYGLAIVRMFVATLLQGFVFSAPPGQTLESMDMTEMPGFVLRKALPLKAVLAPRLPEHVMNAVDIS